MDIALKKKNVYNPVEVMNMSKEVKTNAMRMLDKHHIRYDMIQYECDEFIDGLHTAGDHSWRNFAGTERYLVGTVIDFHC